jgi:hypothetical protein
MTSVSNENHLTTMMKMIVWLTRLGVRMTFSLKEGYDQYFQFKLSRVSKEWSRKEWSRLIQHHQSKAPIREMERRVLGYP